MRLWADVLLMAGPMLASMSATDWSDVDMTELLPTGTVTLLLAETTGQTKPSPGEGGGQRHGAMMVSIGDWLSLQLTTRVRVALEAETSTGGRRTHTRR